MISDQETTLRTPAKIPFRKQGNSVRWSDDGGAAAFLKLVAEAVAQDNHRFFDIVVAESGYRDGGEKKDEPAQPQGIVM